MPWKLPVLISYAYIHRGKEEDKRWLYDAIDQGRIELLLDSGAFTALNACKEISLPEYIQWLKDHQSRLFGYMQLDKLGDPAQTDRNLQTMLDAGLEPLPIHVLGDNEERMEQLFGWSDWVALGGFMRPHRGHCPKSYVKRKMQWARGRNVHWLGYVRTEMIAAFQPFSVDCSSWTYSMRYGWCYFYDNRGTWVKVRRKDRHRTRLSSRMERDIERCGFTAAQWADDEYWRQRMPEKCLHGVLSLYAWMKFSRDVRNRLGTRIFIATPPDHAGIFRLAEAAINGD